MMLGQMIQRVLQAQDVYLDQLGLADVVLLSRIKGAAEAEGVPAASFIGRAVHALINTDDSGVWATLMGKLQDSDAPGYAFVDLAVRQYLARPVHEGVVAGGCGGGSCGCSDGRSMP